jgi:hypothetical protein
MKSEMEFVDFDDMLARHMKAAEFAAEYKRLEGEFKEIKKSMRRGAPRVEAASCYTEWQRGLFEGMSVRELSDLAMNEYEENKQ